MPVCRKLSAQDIQQFRENGFIILPGFYSATAMDAWEEYIATLLRETSAPITVDNLRLGERVLWDGNRLQAKLAHYKFNDLHLIDDRIRSTIMHTDLCAMLSDLFDDTPVLCNSLYFISGSESPQHVDALWTTAPSEEGLLASWVALEDVHIDAGPLTYFPASHKIPAYYFSDGTRHMIESEKLAWIDYIMSAVQKRGLTSQTLLAKKGDLLIWHGQLLHGANPINNPALTRKSLVCHYFRASECREKGAQLQEAGSGYWMLRPPQPIPVSTALYSSVTFPEESYLTRNPDVAAALAKGHFLSGYEHWRKFGQHEGREI